MRTFLSILLGVAFITLLGVGATEFNTPEKYIGAVRNSAQDHGVVAKVGFYTIFGFNCLLLFVSLSSVEFRRQRPQRSLFNIFSITTAIVGCGFWVASYHWGPQMADWLAFRYQSCPHYALPFLGASIVLNLLFIMILLTKTCTGFEGCPGKHGHNGATAPVNEPTPTLSSLKRI